MGRTKLHTESKNAKFSLLKNFPERGFFFVTFYIVWRIPNKTNNMKRNIHDRINLRLQLAKAIVTAAIIKEENIFAPNYKTHVAIRSNRMVLGISK